MNVLVDNFGERIRVFRPYINREEEARNVSITVPESSHNTGLYFAETVDHLTGNSNAGLFVDDAQSVNYWWDMTPTTKRGPMPSLASQLPNTYSSPRNTFLTPGYYKPQYKKLSEIYGYKPKMGSGESGLNF